MSDVGTKDPRATPAPAARPGNDKRFLRVRPPRWGFLKGAAIGTVAGIPGFALLAWLLAHAGFGDEVPLPRVLRFTAIFAGAATVLTAGGVGRLCAQASVDRGGGRLRAMWIGARTYGLAGAGLVLIAMIPHGGMPLEHWRWGVIAVAGGFGGALLGMLLGLGCGGPAPLSLADVLSLARRPANALRELLDTAGGRRPEPHDAPAPVAGLADESSRTKVDGPDA